MKKKISYLLLGLVAFFGMMCTMPAQAEAAKLEWHTTNLYYEQNEEGTPDNILVIEGYFRNRTDKYINYMYEVNLKAAITSSVGSGYTGHVKGTFRNFEKMIAPHGDSYHKFRVRHAEIIWPIESYKVRSGYMKWKNSNAAG